MRKKSQKERQDVEKFEIITPLSLRQRSVDAAEEEALGRRLAQDPPATPLPALINYYQAVLLLEAAFDEVRSSFRSKFSA